MAWRGIHLSRPAHLSVEHRALKIAFRDDETTFSQSIEDLSYLILDSTQITLSQNILAQLAETGTLVIGINDKHLPSWTSLPWTRYYKQGVTLNIQLEATLPQKKQLWASIIKLKIEAQARCLAENSLKGEAYLRKLVPFVRSGDVDNVEARAARFFWQNLFPDREFIRHSDDLPNTLLNYAYALLRAAIARQLCAIGFIPQIGLHHESLSNAYNLADDLIEPYRPIADHFVLIALDNAESSELFSTDHRRSLAQILEAKLTIDGEVYSTIPAIEVTVSSLRKAIQQKDHSLLKFPIYTPNS